MSELRDRIAEALWKRWGCAGCAGVVIDADPRTVAEVLLPVVEQEIEHGQRDLAAKVEALIPGFERDYGIQSSPVSRLRALLADIQKGEE